MKNWSVIHIIVIKMLELLTLSFAAVLAVYFLIKFINTDRNAVSDSKKRAYPRLKGVPFLGNTLQVVKTSWPIKGVPPIAYTLQALMGCAKLFKNDSFFHVQLGPLPMIFLFKAHAVEKLLKSTTLLTKPYQYKFLRPWLGEGLITSTPTVWKQHRRLLTPTFHFKILDQFQPIMYDKSQILVDKLKKHVNSDDAVNIEPFISLCTMDIICQTAMGLDMNAQIDDSDYIKAMQTLCLTSFERMIRFELWPDLLFRISKTGRDYLKSNRIAQEFIENLICNRKNEFLLNNPDDNSSYTDEQKTPRAFLDMLTLQHIQDGNLSLKDIKDEVNTFMFAGQDTTGVGLIWALFLLGNYPKVQNTLAQELYDVLGDDCDRPITIEDLKSLKYLDCVVKESQRLYPSVPMIARHLDEDFEIDGLILKKGSTCAAFVNALHYDPDIFPEPEQFVPERFLQENASGRHPFAFVPFSAGSRNCVGQRFAFLEEKTILTNILRNYEITAVDHRDKIPVSSELVSRPAKPIMMKIRARCYS